MDIISELAKAPKEYFLNISKENGNIICGGYDGSNFFGSIEIEILPERVIVNKTASDGVTGGSLQAPDEYSNLMPVYKLAVHLKKDVEELESNSEFMQWQENNRRNLMLNTSKILPYVNMGVRY
jgi:hypothetical protein